MDSSLALCTLNGSVSFAMGRYADGNSRPVLTRLEELHIAWKRAKEQSQQMQILYYDFSYWNIHSGSLHAPPPGDTLGKKNLQTPCIFRVPAMYSTLPKIKL